MGEMGEGGQEVHTSNYSASLNNAGVGSANPPLSVENLSITLMAKDSTSWGSCSTVVFTTEENPHI